MHRLPIALAFVASLAVPALAEGALRLELVATGFPSAVAVVEDPASQGTLLVIAQDGVVHVVTHGSTRETPFLDLREAVSRGGERGRLGLAFPPDAVASGRVFVNFTDRAGHTVIARFLRRADDPLVADPDSRFDLPSPRTSRFSPRRCRFPECRAGSTASRRRGSLSRSPVPTAAIRAA